MVITNYLQHEGHLTKLKYKCINDIFYVLIIIINKEDALKKIHKNLTLKA